MQNTPMKLIPQAKLNREERLSIDNLYLRAVGTSGGAVLGSVVSVLADGECNDSKHSHEEVGAREKSVLFLSHFLFLI